MTAVQPREGTMADNLDRATPRPWAVNPVRAQIDAFDTGLPVCQMLWPTDERTEAETKANAALIVKAVNAYDDMLTALKAVVDSYFEHDRERGGSIDDESIQQVRAAIAKAAT